MTNRDANRGGCAQSCRWNYDIIQNGEKISNNSFDFSLASRDLNAIEFIPQLIDAGVASLKIEGRMKSLHYIATIVNAYRRCIDEYYKNKSIKDFDIYKNNLSKGENREVSHGFFKGELTPNEEIYNHGISQPNHDFVGIVLDYDEDTKIVTVEQRNVFSGNREIEILSPYKEPYKVKIKAIYDKDGNEIESARNAQMIVRFKCEVPLKEFDLIR